MRIQASNTATNPVAIKRPQIPSIRLGLARYLACRELSLLVREDENMCPVPIHPQVLLEELARKQSEGQLEV